MKALHALALVLMAFGILAVYQLIQRRAARA